MKALLSSFASIIVVLATSFACSDDTTTLIVVDDDQDAEAWQASSGVDEDVSARGLYVSYNPLANEDTGNYADEQHGSEEGVLVSWRWLAGDSDDAAFDVYRSVDGGDFVKLNSSPITSSTCYSDKEADVTCTNTYRLCAADSDVQLGDYEFTPDMATTFYRTISLNMSDLPDAGDDTYKVSDAAVGDLDGDGEWEIVIKRQTASIDNASSGLAQGSGLLEAYRMDGTFMWRVALGPNIRQGTHYIPFIVYDFDLDGRAELAVRTSELTEFGDGTVIEDTDGDGITYYVDTIATSNTYGKIISGPEFLSVIDGTTGAELARTDYISRGDESTWSTYWGDSYANRQDRFLMAVGHFTSESSAPSIVMCRGYYKNWQMTAVDYADGELTERWHFDTDPDYTDYIGQGNHNLAVGDVDNDGRDEIIYGACCIDHDGTGLYSTGLGHGDALHLGQFDPTRDGLQVFACHEDADQYGSYGTEMHDAATGEILASLSSSGDVGRCMVADIDPDTPGCEIWSSSPAGKLYSCQGVELDLPAPVYKPGLANYTYNMGIWWTGSLNRQNLDKGLVISYTTSDTYEERDFTATKHDSTTAQGTKYNPCIYADLWGDWREEMIYTNEDYSELHIFTTNIATGYRFHPLMDDHVYRMSVAHQNVGYNQPTHTGFYLGSDLIKSDTISVIVYSASED